MADDHYIIIVGKAFTTK